MTIAKAAPPAPTPDGYYGEFGGRFVAETLVAAIEDLDPTPTVITAKTKPS